MINLLPPKEKQELLFQNTQKLVVVLGSVVLISLVSLILVLASVKFYILSEINYQKLILNSTEKKYQTPDFLSSKDLIKKYNEALAKASSFYKKEVRASGAVHALAGIPRPSGVYLTNINIEKNKETNKLKASISGFADTRENLMLFKEGVEENNRIKNVDFPPNNWIKPRDLTFYFTFEYDGNQK